MDAVVWYSGNSGSSTRPVCTKARNGFGLCDTSGNVIEWTSDWYGGYSSAAAIDPIGPASGSSRVARGGGWFLVARYVRVAIRYGGSPDIRGPGLGFRLVRSVP